MNVAKKIVVSAEDIEVSDGLKSEIAKSVSENLNSFIQSAIQDAWCVFEDGNADEMGGNKGLSRSR